MNNNKFCCLMFLLTLTTVIMVLILTACSVEVPPASSPLPITSTQPVITSTASQTTRTPVISSTSIQTPQTPVSTTATSVITSPPSPSTTTQPLPPTSSIYSPEAEPYIPKGTEIEIYQYMLDLINKDRHDAGLGPVIMNYNAAAHIHAKDMLDNNYQAAHWGTDGQKPYMRYTEAGGLNYEQENSAYYSSSHSIVVKDELAALQHNMMYDDAASNWGHKDNILNKWHKKVNLGIAYNTSTVALVQQFEGDYVEYSQPPTLNGNTLSLTGHFLQSGFILNNISIAFDSLPQPISPSQLTTDIQYHHYGLGQRLGLIFPPPPDGQTYQNLPADSIVAQKGSFNYDGWFYIEADISKILSKGPGVYTVVLVALSGNEPINLTNYSLFVE